MDNDENKNQTSGAGQVTPPATPDAEINSATLNAKPAETTQAPGGVTTPPAATELEPTVADLVKIIQKQAEDIEILKGAADKGRVESFLNKRRKAPTPVVKVSFFDGKYIVAWKNALDEVYRDSDGVWHEKQIMEVTFEDGTTRLLPYIDFQRLIERRPAEIVKRNRNTEEDPETGVTYDTESFTVKVQADGKVMTLDGAFIN